MAGKDEEREWAMWVCVDWATTCFGSDRCIRINDLPQYCTVCYKEIPPANKHIMSHQEIVDAECNVGAE